MTLGWRHFDQDAEPPVKRKRKSPEEPFSVHRYCAGRNWHALHENDLGHILAIGKRLYRFDSYVYEPNESRVILASDDYGKTWESYSMLPYPMEDFGVLPVTTCGKVVVYLMGGRRAISRRVQITADVWISNDLLKTFELVTDKAEFGPRVKPQCFARSDGTLLVHNGWIRESENVYPIDNWISKDGGRSWALTDRNWWYSKHPDSFPTIQRPLRRFMAFDNAIYALTERYDKQTLCHTVDRETAWREVPHESFIPQTVVADKLSDRLIAFSTTNCYYMGRGTEKWIKLGNDWRTKMLTFIPTGNKKFRGHAAHCFSDGVILLTASASIDYSTGTFNVISYPERGLALHHKTLLAMYLARFRIDSALFARFLFPY